MKKHSPIDPGRRVWESTFQAQDSLGTETIRQFMKYPGRLRDCPVWRVDDDLRAQTNGTAEQPLTGQVVSRKTGASR